MTVELGPALTNFGGGGVFDTHPLAATRSISPFSLAGGVQLGPVVGKLGNGGSNWLLTPIAGKRYSLGGYPNGITVLLSRWSSSGTIGYQIEDELGEIVASSGAGSPGNWTGSFSYRAGPYGNLFLTCSGTASMRVLISNTHLTPIS